MTKLNDGQQRENAHNMLYNAAKIITTQRGNQHGGAENSFQTIGDLWTTLLKQATIHRRGGEGEIVAIDDLQITPADVAHMMNILKIARAIHGDPLNEDNYVDAAGYAALAGSLSLGNKVVAKMSDKDGPTEKAQQAVDQLKAKQEADDSNRRKELESAMAERDKMESARAERDKMVRTLAAAQRSQSIAPQVVTDGQ
jgi:hypothetical protein